MYRVAVEERGIFGQLAYYYEKYRENGRQANRQTKSRVEQLAKAEKGKELAPKKHAGRRAVDFVAFCSGQEPWVLGSGADRPPFPQPSHA
jgi:hypothetical protein